MNFTLLMVEDSKRSRGDKFAVDLESSGERTRGMQVDSREN